MAGRDYLGQYPEPQLADMVLLDHLQETRSWLLFVFDQEVAARAVGILVCFSPGEDK